MLAFYFSNGYKLEIIIVKITMVHWIKIERRLYPIYFRKKYKHYQRCVLWEKFIVTKFSIHYFSPTICIFLLRSKRWRMSRAEIWEIVEIIQTECHLCILTRINRHWFRLRIPISISRICLTSLTRAKCGTRSTLCWKILNISHSTELFAL